MNENIQFLRAFLKNPGKVGAIAPSSPELAQTMVNGLTPDKDNIILELGVGTGAITKFIEPILPDSDSYLGLELDPKLHATLNIAYPDLNIIQGNACGAYKIHQNSGLGKVKYLVCCLPFVSLPRAVADQIYGQIDLFMEDGCTLRLFQYAHGYYLPPALKLRERMRNLYGRSNRSRIVLKNVPPAYTLTWSTI
jgi:phosphatidylethanolamine/phosphatidyl-N-methylethanolamine N-methyltransferase